MRNRSTGEYIINSSWLSGWVESSYESIPTNELDWLGKTNTSKVRKRKIEG